VGFLIFIWYMKLLSLLKNVIVESIPIKNMVVDGQPLKIVQTYESLRAITGNGKYIRVTPNEIVDSMSDIYDILIDQSFITLKTCKYKCSLLVRDYRLGFDYQLFIHHYAINNTLKITINTSIRHPKKLYNNVNTREIIITKNNDIAIKESIVDKLFTYKIIGDIIVYYQK
jgi:hypothetical protein